MKALIAGITGQDGSYLAELLLAKGYEVHGIARPSMKPREPIAGARLWEADVTDAETISRIVALVQPGEIYNLAAQSHVGLSFEAPSYTAQVTGIGTVNMLQAMKTHAPHARFYQPSSSEMFGNQAAPQHETTPFAPVSPYGWAKMFAHNTAAGYRQAYGLHVSCGILFNHESPRRGERFVTRKICKGLARIKAGLQDSLQLGNLGASRDWGYAPEYVEAMWMMLQRDTPDDYVIGTGESYTVLEFLIEAGKGMDLSKVEFDSSMTRPAEVNALRAKPAKAESVLGWTAKTKMPALARIMMAAELHAAGL